MPQPTRYIVSFDFTGFSQSFPDTPLPGNRIDAELAALKQTLDETLDNLELIQRDDGKLRDDAVHKDAIDGAVFQELLVGGAGAPSAAIAAAASASEASNSAVAAAAAAGEAQTYRDDLTLNTGAAQIGTAMLETQAALNARGLRYATVALAAAATIPAIVAGFATQGYAAAGDGGHASYIRVGSEPAHAGKIQSVDGAWWELNEEQPNILMFGADRTGVASSTSAIQAAIDYAATQLDVSLAPYRRVTHGVYAPAGKYLIGSGTTVRFKYGVPFRGAGRALTWFTHGGGNVDAFDTSAGLTENGEIEISDFTLNGAGATTTYGLDLDGAIRNATLRNVNVYNCNINIRMTDCWTFLFDRCNLRNAIQQNLEWYNATAGCIKDSRIDSAGRTNILIDASASYATVNFTLINSYVQFAQWYGINIVSAVTVNIFGGYIEGNNVANANRADILWQSVSDGSRTLNLYGCWFSSAGGSNSTTAIVARGETLNLYGCHINSGGLGYVYSIDTTSGNCDVVNLFGSQIYYPTNLASTTKFNDYGRTDGGNNVSSLKVDKKFGFGVPTDLTIASGAITVTKSNHRVDTEAAAATDDLQTINGGVDGQFLTLRTVDSARDVVIKHNTGNIKIASGADFTLSTNIKTITLIYCADVGAGFWLQIAAV